MGFLLDHVDEATFKTQREVVKNDRRQRVENVPYGNVSELVLATVYPPRHPYHRGVLGSWEDLESASLGDVRGFFREHYQPGNATLTLAGALPEELRRDGPSEDEFLWRPSPSATCADEAIRCLRA